MNYINQILNEVDTATAALYGFASKPENYNIELITLVLNQIEAMNRFKMRLESSGLFRYSKPLDDEKVKELLNFVNKEY